MCFLVSLQLVDLVTPPWPETTRPAETEPKQMEEELDPDLALVKITDVSLLSSKEGEKANVLILWFPIVITLNRVD